MIFQIATLTSADDATTVSDFVPQVTATCKAGVMSIKVILNGTYSGAVHARDFRKPQCMQQGNGSNTVSLSINLFAKQGQPDYCGVLVHNVSQEVRSTVCFINAYLQLLSTFIEKIHNLPPITQSIFVLKTAKNGR